MCIPRKRPFQAASLLLAAPHNERARFGLLASFLTETLSIMLLYMYKPSSCMIYIYI